MCNLQHILECHEELVVLFFVVFIDIQYITNYVTLISKKN